MEKLRKWWVRLFPKRLGTSRSFPRLWVIIWGLRPEIKLEILVAHFKIQRKLFWWSKNRAKINQKLKLRVSLELNNSTRKCWISMSNLNQKMQTKKNKFHQSLSRFMSKRKKKHGSPSNWRSFHTWNQKRLKYYRKFQNLKTNLKSLITFASNSVKEFKTQTI